MKKLFFLIFLTFSVIACKKDKQVCYECDFDGDTVYTDQGCFTKSDWEATTFTDNLGNPLDKSKCRKK